jgi:hypothetical protein
VALVKRPSVLNVESILFCQGEPEESGRRGEFANRDSLLPVKGLAEWGQTPPAVTRSFGTDCFNPASSKSARRFPSRSAADERGSLHAGVR